MKIYMHEKGFIMVGKAWEIREKLKQYKQNYIFLKDWIQDVQPKRK